MKISTEWLNEFIKTQGSTEDISNVLSMLGLEAESSNGLVGLDDIIIGEVRDCKKHPNADRLNVCKVYDGKKELPIVCGAPNVKTGQKIVFAPVNSVLPGNFKINKAKIRGKISEGMICSEKELGISQDHEGIMVLPENAQAGDSFQNYYNRKDILELDITPNRADCFSHLGIARDYATKINKKLNLPNYDVKKFSINKASEAISINIDNPDDCPRYVAGVVDNVKVKPSPKWLQERLESLGHRSINNIVDISNYVMLEMGQPTHMFDADMLGSNEILIRRGKTKEKIVTLDGVERTISPNELVITNGKNPIAIAGIMGGMDSSVTENTSKVVIESAYFEPTVIRKSAKSLNMSTDASKRFERGADPNGAEMAFWRIVSLLEDLAEGKWIDGIVDSYPKKIHFSKINLRKSKLDQISGFSIKKEFVENTLNALGCEVKNSDSDWICVPPSWRPDLTREIDLVEEVIRVYGYDNIDSKHSFNSSMETSIVDPLNEVDTINNLLNGFGFTQIFNNTLQSEVQVSTLDCKPISVLNPISDKMTHLRTSLIEGLLITADYNFKNGQKNIMLFESGNVFFKSGDGLKGLNEKYLLSGIAFGNMHNSSVHLNKAIKNDFYTIKGLLASLLKRLNIDKVNLDKTDSSQSHFDNSYLIEINKNNIGCYGKLSDLMLKKLNLDISHIYGFELNLKDLIKIHSSASKRFKTINYFPKIERDLNFVVDEGIKVGDIIKKIESLSRETLISINPKNLFRHKSLGDLKKSVTINLEFQHPSKTLEDKDVNPIINEIIKVVSKNFGAKLRQ